MDLTAPRRSRPCGERRATGSRQAVGRQPPARPVLCGLCVRVSIGSVNAELVMTEDDGSAPAVEGAAQLGLLAAELPSRLTVAHGKPAAR